MGQHRDEITLATIGGGLCACVFFTLGICAAAVGGGLVARSGAAVGDTGLSMATARDVGVDALATALGFGIGGAAVAGAESLKVGSRVIAPQIPYAGRVAIGTTIELPPAIVNICRVVCDDRTTIQSQIRAGSTK